VVRLKAAQVVPRIVEADARTLDVEGNRGVLRAERPAGRVTVVVITRNRRRELLRTLDRLAELPERVPVIVVDNGSDDGTSRDIGELHPAVTLVTADRNLGAAGRNLAARLVATPSLKARAFVGAIGPGPIAPTWLCFINHSLSNMLYQ